MNPLTNVKNITKLNETELASGLIHKKSWHDMYKDSAWIFIGGLAYDLTEGDILAVFSQYGEIVNINLVRDKKTGKSKGFCFLCYSNQKSTVLAVDNFNGIKLCNRTIRVDHVANYKPPKENERDDEVTKTLKTEGCAPAVMQTLFTDDAKLQTKKKKSKKEKKEKKKKKRKHGSEAADSDNDTAVKIKKEKHDPGYDKYDSVSNKTHGNKVKHSDNSSEKPKGESSQVHEKTKSKNDRTRESDRMNYKDNYSDNNGVVERPNKSKREEEYSRHREIYKDTSKATSSSKSHKRKRSSSLSDDTSRIRTDDIRHRHEEGQIKSRHLDNKKRYKDTHSSTSSSDSDSSSQSSSDDVKSKDNRKYSENDRYRTYNNEKKSKSYQEESRQKHYQKGENSSHKPSKSISHDRTEKYSDYRSKAKHRSDDSDDTGHRNSDYHRRKHDRR